MTFTYILVAFEVKYGWIYHIVTRIDYNFGINFPSILKQKNPNKLGYLQVKKLVFVQLISQKLRNVEKDEEGYACSCADALQRSQYIYIYKEWMLSRNCLYFKFCGKRICNFRSSLFQSFTRWEQRCHLTKVERTLRIVTIWFPNWNEDLNQWSPRPSWMVQLWLKSWTIHEGLFECFKNGSKLTTILDIA